jgi:hypothetical protein
MFSKILSANRGAGDRPAVASISAASGLAAGA